MAKRDVAKCGTPQNNPQNKMLGLPIAMPVTTHAVRCRDFHVGQTTAHMAKLFRSHSHGAKQKGPLIYTDSDRAPSTCMQMKVLGVLSP